MKKGKQITVNGKTFISKAEACRYYNLPQALVDGRLKNGWSIEEAFELVKRDNHYININIEGKSFLSAREACKYYNLKYGTVLNRLREGWSIEEAFELVERNKTYKSISIGGKTFKSISEACRYYKVDRSLINNRLYKYGWTIEEAFGIINKSNYEEIFVKGKYFASLLEACEYYDTDLSLVYNRINKGWDIVDALLTPVLKELKGKEITLEGKTFISIAEACRYYNLQGDRVRSRLKIGWTLEEAFELVKRDKGIITVENKTFKSLPKACKYYNINYRLVSNRLNRGWSIEEAFELVERKNERFINITLEGRTFKSIKEAADHYNIDYKKVSTRLRNGWSYEEALEIIDRLKRKNRGNSKPITINGITYDSEMEACRHYNVNYRTFKSRLNRKGLSIEEAIGLV